MLAVVFTLILFAEAAMGSRGFCPFLSLICCALAASSATGAGFWFAAGTGASHRLHPRLVELAQPVLDEHQSIGLEAIAGVLNHEEALPVRCRGEARAS